MCYDQSKPLKKKDMLFSVLQLYLCKNVKVLYI